MKHLQSDALLGGSGENLSSYIHILEVGIRDEFLKTLQGDLPVPHHGLFGLFHGCATLLPRAPAFV
jgi:hypothetical protein